MARIKWNKRNRRRKGRWNYRQFKSMEDLLRAEDNFQNRMSTNQGIDLIKKKLQEVKATAETLLKDLEDENQSNSAGIPRLPPLLPESISGRNHGELATVDSEIRRRFLEWQNTDPVIETTVDTERNELRLVAIIHRIRKEDIEIEVTPNCFVLKTNGTKDAEILAVAVPFYVPVIPQSIETSFVNGILEARFKLRNNSNECYKVRVR